MTTATHTSQTAGTGLRDIPIAQLTAHPGNVRRELKVTAEFRASVLRRMLTPLLVVPAGEDTYRVFDGCRRLLVHVEAGREAVSCLVFEDVDAAEEYLAMMTTAGQREGLSHTEQAQALFEAAELGAGVKRMAEATGWTQRQVKTAVRYAGSEKLRQVTGAGTEAALGLDLEQMAAMIEFEDDPEALKTLTEAAQGGNFTYHLRKLRNEREERQRIKAERAEFAAAGIRMAEAADLPETATEVFYLRTAEDERISEEDHRQCPGHVLTLDEGYMGHHWRVHCLNPGEHGHQVCQYAPAKQEEPGPDPEAMRAVKQGNKDWTAATDVRREWLAAFTRRKTFPKDAQERMSRFAARQMLKGGYIITNGMNTPEAVALAAGWLGVAEQVTAADLADAADTADARRLVLHHFAAVAAPMERQAGAKDRRAWRTDRHAYSDGLRERIGEYLRALEELGYELSPIERAVAEGQTYEPFGQADAAPAELDPEGEGEPAAEG